MYLIGLTGGIAAGKSTVAALWQSLGAVHVDADELAREVVEPGTPGLAAVVARFGESVLGPEGQLDRKRLAALVFGDDQARHDIEAILHPAIRALAEAKLQDIAAATPDATVVYSIPLLVETNSAIPFDTVVTVEAPYDKQVARLVKNRGMSETEAKARIAAQANPIERATRADHILSSNQELALLLRDAEQLYRSFEAAK